jgi:hypothetical protein
MSSWEAHLGHDAMRLPPWFCALAWVAPAPLSCEKSG